MTTALSPGQASDAPGALSVQSDDGVDCRGAASENDGMLVVSARFFLSAPILKTTDEENMNDKWRREVRYETLTPKE
jgi:hypothetical protein